MSVGIKRLTPVEVVEWVFANGLENDDSVWQRCIAASGTIWMGTYDDKPACVLGLIPPTLLSSQAYLWLYTTDVIKGHEFLFVRYSQIMVDAMLEEYDEIVGHTRIAETRSIRWLKWLGAKFGKPNGLYAPFVIRKKTNG